MRLSYAVNYWVEVARNERVTLRVVSAPLRVIPAGLRAHDVTARLLVRRMVAASCAVPTDELHCPRG